MRLIKAKGLSIINAHIIDYPTPVVNYLSSFGSLAGLSLSVQLVTGILLVAHYTNHISLAFFSIEHIMRDVNDGWLFRYYHSNGASIFFLCIYCHIYNNLSSEADDLLWASGAALYLLIMAAAFMGYILPWGQMSYWGATVITNLFTAIPFVGVDVATWLWGGFSVDNPTLSRFFSFHYLIPFLIAGLVIVHLTLLHIDESSTLDSEYVDFYYYYYPKDLYAFMLLFCLFSYFVFYSPNYLSHPDNYTLASIVVTPRHLVPEWYSLPFYAVLRATPDKFGGLILMVLVLVDILFIDNVMDDRENLSLVSDISQFGALNEPVQTEVETDDDAASLLILFFLGGRDIDEPYTDVASVLTFINFINNFEISDENEYFDRDE